MATPLTPQRAHVRWPTPAEILDFLSRRYEEGDLALPPGAQVEPWSDVPTFPVLLVTPPVAERSVYFFTASQLIGEAAIPPDRASAFAEGLTKRLSVAVRRIFLFLNFIPLAWTAPAVDDPFSSLEVPVTAPAPLPRLNPPGSVQLTLKMNPASVVGHHNVGHSSFISAFISLHSFVLWGMLSR